MSKSLRAVLAVVALLLIAGAVAYLVRSPREPLPAPAKAVEAVLLLRAEASADTTAYAGYFETTELAQALAEDPGNETGTRRVPEWKSIEVVSSDETSANVLVTWRPSADFEGWPETTTFTLTMQNGRWVIMDAWEHGSTEASGTVEATTAP